MSKLSDALDGFRTAAECPHEFDYIGPNKTGGEVGRCRHCRCRFTTWPGTVHYDDIVAARDLQK